MDLADLDTSARGAAGVPMPLRHPATDAPLTDDAGAPIELVILGGDSDAMQAAVRANLDRRIEMTGRPTAEIIDRENISLCAAAIRSWGANLVVDGKPLAYSPDAALSLLTRFRWMREQVQRFMGDRANFTAPAASG